MSSPHGPATPNARDHGNDLSDTAFDGAIKEIAAMPLASYARGRRDEARRLGIGVSALDKIVAAARPPGEAEPGQGRPLELATPEPWPEPVNGAALVAELTTAIRRYVVLSASDALTVALWVLHTYCFDVFSCTPRLAITAPEKRCGKTTLLDVIALIVSKALPTANISAAALFRTVELARPTLLIDEADAFLGESEELRGILNSGHRAGGQVIRTVGDDFEPRAFSTHCPVAIAQIGKLPDTLADRSIHISMKRRAPGETVARFCYGRTPDLSEVAMKATRWGADNADAIRACDPNIPDAIFNRAADNWAPLLAVAEVAGGDIPERARQVALAACGVEEEPSHGAMLLADIRSVFEEKDCTRITSADLIAALVNMADRPWGECNHGKALTQNQLARRLKLFGVGPKTVRTDGDRLKGYELVSFTDAFNRYISPFQSVTPAQVKKIKELDENQTVTAGGHVTVANQSKPLNSCDCHGVTVANPLNGGMRDVKDGNRETEAKDRKDRVIACGMALANWTRRFGVPTTANSELIRCCYQLGPTSLDEERIIFGFTSDAAREAELGYDLHADGADANLPLQSAPEKADPPGWRARL
jgi:putative DNA primase/helicase